MYKIPLIVGFIELILLLTFLSAPYGNCSNDWDFHTIDRPAVVTSSFSAVIDSTDNVHIAFLAYENESIKSSIKVMYGVWNKLSWSITEVATGRGTVDIALDSTNNPCIVFNDYKNFSLQYARWIDGKWVIQTIDNNGVTASLEVASGDKPHIAYLGGGHLKYASWDGSWNIQTIDSIQSLVNRVSLVLDSNNYPHILYGKEGYTVNQAIIKYAVLTKSGWSIQDAVYDVPDDYGNLVLDSYNNPHFIYKKNNPTSTDINSTLLYRSWNGSNWMDQIVSFKIDRLFGAGQLILDTHDYPHIVFLNKSRDLSIGTLMYAKLSDDKWVLQKIDDNTVAGVGPIVVDSNGNPHILYLALSQDYKINYLIHAIYNALEVPVTEQAIETYFWMPLMILIAALSIVICTMESIKKRKFSR